MSEKLDIHPGPESFMYQPQGFDCKVEVSTDCHIYVTRSFRRLLYTINEANGKFTLGNRHKIEYIHRKSRGCQCRGILYPTFVTFFVCCTYNGTFVWCTCNGTFVTCSDNSTFVCCTYNKTFVWCTYNGTFVWCTYNGTFVWCTCNYFCDMLI